MAFMISKNLSFNGLTVAAVRATTATRVASARAAFFLRGIVGGSAAC